MIPIVAEGRFRPDEDRIREFVSHDFARMVAVLTLVCSSRAISEEVVQEALARAWEKQLQGEQIESLPAWVTTVAMNLARSRRRRFLVEMRARQRLSRAPAGAPADTLEERLDLLQAIKRLPMNQREAIALHYFIDLDGNDVAKSLGLSESAVKSLLFRARRTLEASLGSENTTGQGSNDAES
jgi:RNA polymerase sigma-70 factor, ECF subfamily